MANVSLSGKAAATNLPLAPVAVAGTRRMPLVAWCLIALAAFVAYHLWLIYLMRHTGLELGVVRPGTRVYRIVPIYMHVRVHLRLWLLPAVAACAGIWWWYQRLQTREEPPRPAALVASLMLIHGGLACAVALIDGGLDRLWRPYELLVATDYIGAVPQVQSPAWFLGNYVALLPELPMHCQTHPPGGPLFLWLVAQWLGPGAAPAAAASIVAGTLAMPAVWGLARCVLPWRGAALACLLFALAPCIVLFTATGMDIVFSVPMIWTFYLMWKARTAGGEQQSLCPPVLWGAAGGLAAAVAALMTFSAAFLVFWALAVAVLTVCFDRQRLRATLAAWIAAAVTSALFYGLLYLATGYNLIETLMACTQRHVQIMEGGNYGSWRQYGHLVVGNLAAFLFCVGLPLAVLWLRQTWRDLRRPARDGAWLLGVSYALALAVLVLLPIHTLEVEHIWLYMVPLVAIAAVRALQSPDDNRGRETSIAVLLLMLQIVVMEVCLTTNW